MPNGYESSSNESLENITLVLNLILPLGLKIGPKFSSEIIMYSKTQSLSKSENERLIRIRF